MLHECLLERKKKSTCRGSRCKSPIGDTKRWSTGSVRPSEGSGSQSHCPTEFSISQPTSCVAGIPGTHRPSHACSWLPAPAGILGVPGLCLLPHTPPLWFSCLRPPSPFLHKDRFTLSQGLSWVASLHSSMSAKSYFIDKGTVTVAGDLGPACVRTQLVGA